MLLSSSIPVRAGTMTYHTWGRDRYKLTIWFDGPHMYATCEAMKGKTFSDLTLQIRGTVENRLWRALRDDWNVLASNLTLKYEKGRVCITFNDPEEFVMTKMLYNGV